MPYAVGEVRNYFTNELVATVAPGGNTFEVTVSGASNKGGSLALILLPAGMNAGGRFVALDNVRDTSAPATPTTVAGPTQTTKPAAAKTTTTKKPSTTKKPATRTTAKPPANKTAAQSTIAAVAASQSTGSKVTIDDADRSFSFAPATDKPGSENTSWVKYGPGLNAATGDYQLGNHTTALAGAKLTLTFEGRELRLFGAKGDAYGRFSVSINGGAAVTVDAYSSTPPGPTTRQQLLYSSPGLAAGRHTAVVTVLGTKAAGSSGTFVVIDKAEVTP